MNYYIQGNKEKAQQIKAAFEKRGYDISWPGGCADPDVFNIGVERNGAKYVVAETYEYIKDIIKTHPDYKELQLPDEPKFKVGDVIIWNEPKGSKPTEPVKIMQLIDKDQLYMVDMSNGVGYVAYDMQDYYKLVQKPHYDIANFKPFDKVLVRNKSTERWHPSLYATIDGLLYYTIDCNNWQQCLPYEGNKHLVGTTNKPE